MRTSRGFIGKFASLLGDAKINIATFHLGRVKAGRRRHRVGRGVDGTVPADLLTKVQALPQVKQVKALVFLASGGFGAAAFRGVRARDAHDTQHARSTSIDV